MADGDLLNGILEESTPRSLRLLAARGLVPVPQAEMLQLLVRLTHDPDTEVAQQAVDTLSSWAEADILTQLQSSRCSAEVLEHYAGSAGTAFQEAVILNPQATAAVIAGLARVVPAPLLEIILYNRTRLLEAPEILQCVKRNPAATAQVLGLVQEIETEFFGTKKQAYTAEEQVPDVAADETSLGLEAEPAPEDLSLEGLPVDPQERDAAILTKVSRMTVRQKVQLALLGTREARAILIRDINKDVWRGVLQSPKLTLFEVEAFAAMRTISEDVLRQIAINKAWTKSYALVHNLVKNPKTPPMISQRMLSRLSARDLKMIARDRGITEAVRRQAERMLKQRSPNQSMG